MAKFRQKIKRLINFLTILDHFWDFLKPILKKASLGLKKRF